MRSHLKQIFTGALLFVLVNNLSAQTITMGKECKASMDKAITELRQKQFDVAIQTIDGMTACNTKDAKLEKEVVKAEAYNGLGKYQEALGAANYALKMSKNGSIGAWFQRAVAENKTGNVAASKESLAKVMALTEKNVNVKERASNYALMAALYDRQLGETDSAHYYIDQAITLDPTNYRYILEKGDMHARKKQYDQAFALYDKVSAMGKTDLELYQTVCDTRIRMLQEKHGTENVQELRKKLTAEEKSDLCRDMKKATELGMKDMQKDMMYALICN
jgi:tetratricopeptide (TPR) repeat protein